MGDSMPTSRTKSIYALAAERQQLWDEFNRKTTGESRGEQILKRSGVLETRILKASFAKPATKLAGLRILLTGEDNDPESLSCFKSDLFKRMMQFA
jgi:hypothetical protein